MSEPSFLEVASAIRKILQQNLPTTQHPSTSRPTIEQLTPQPPIPQPFIDLSHHASSWKLPAAVSSELTALIPAESMKYRDITSRAHLQLLQEIYASCDGITAASIVPHAQAARDALHARMVNTLLDSIQQLAVDVDLENGAASDADESDSDSESGSEEDDDDEAEGAEEEPEEDENSPMKPGEEVPPLEIKYLPIFEALHERGKVLTKPEKTYLVNLTGMTYRQITIWFQNRRRGELKEDMAARAHSYAISTHSDQSSELSDDEYLEKRLSIQPSDTTFDIRSWRLASAMAPSDARTPSFPSSPTKTGFTGVHVPRPGPDDSDSDLTDSEDEGSRSDVDNRVPSLTTSSATFDSSSDRGPATIVSGSSCQARSGQPTDPVITTEKGGEPRQIGSMSRPIKSLPSARRTTPPVQRPASSQSKTTVNSLASAPAPAPAPAANSQVQFLSVSVVPPVQSHVITSNERGLTVQMDATPPGSTITLQTQHTATNTGDGPTSSASPPSPVLQSGSPHSSSPSPSGHSILSPRPAVKPLPRRTGCAPRPRPPPRSVPTPVTSAAPTGSTSARSSVVLPPSSNPSLAGTTLGALLRPSIPPPRIPPEMEERLSAMAGRMGVGTSANGVRRVGPAHPQHPMSFGFGPTSLPGLGPSPRATPALPPTSEPRDFTSKN